MPRTPYARRLSGECCSTPARRIALLVRFGASVGHVGDGFFGLGLDFCSGRCEVCFLLQRVRDEAHRFAVAYHRRLRSRKQRTSELHKVAGLGDQRTRSLLQFFGGMRELKAASAEQLTRAPGVGKTLARRIYTELHPD